MIVVLSLMAVALSLMPEHEFDVISLWQMVQLVVDAGTDILGEGFQEALSSLV